MIPRETSSCSVLSVEPVSTAIHSILSRGRFSQSPEIFDPSLDRGIAPYVAVLRFANIETFESCEGGNGHTYPEPTIRFYGDRSEGFRALAKVIQEDLPISALRRVWIIEDGEPTGPHWEMTFYRKSKD